MKQAAWARWDSLYPMAIRMRRRIGPVVYLALLFIAGWVPAAHGALWQRPEAGTDLWYSGFLHAEASYTDVSGSLYEYEEGYFRGQQDGSLDAKGSFHVNGFLREGLHINTAILFDTRYERYPQRYWDRRFWDTFRMKLVMDTPQPINDRWKFHARAVYDREDTWRDDYPDARLLMEPIDDARLEVFSRLESENFIFEGGDLKSDFGGRGFVLYQRDLLGLHANAHNDLVEADVIGGRVKGTTFLQTPDDTLGIRADGTAGPYRLTHAPIVRGSEVVAIEVRDQYDQTIRIRRTPQRRNIDYTVDYLRGVVTFMEPVQSETFEGHPVYISIQYSFDEREAGYRRYLAGTRTDLKLGERVRAGILYASVYDDENSWRGEGSEQPPPERRGAYGGIFEADLFDHTRIEATAALSDSGQLGREHDNGALGLSFNSRSIPRLDLQGDFQRIEHNYEALDNRTLVGQRNRQEVRLEGTYAAAAKVDLEGGGRQVEAANPEIDDNAYTDLTTFAGLRYRPMERTELGYRHEWRMANDEKDIHLRDEYRETSTLSASQRFARARVRLAAEREHFTNHILPDSATGARQATWRLRGGLDLTPADWLSSRLVLKTELLRDREADQSTARTDRAEAAATVEVGRAYVFRADAEWVNTYTLDQAGYQFTGGTQATRAGAYSLGADLRPIDPVQLILGYDYERLRDEIESAVERQSELIRAEGYWYITRDLELHGAAGREDLRDARKIGIANGMLRRYEERYDLDLTYNYTTRFSFFTGMQLKLRRIFNPEHSDTDLQRFRIGANWHVHPRLELTARLRYTDLNGEPVSYTAANGTTTLAFDEAFENHRWIATGEVALDVGRMWRCAIGYETLEYGVDSVQDSPDDYAADRVYLKLMQKF